MDSTLQWSSYICIYFHIFLIPIRSNFAPLPHLFPFHATPPPPMCCLIMFVCVCISRKCEQNSGMLLFPPPPLPCLSQLFPLSSLVLPRRGFSIRLHRHPSVLIPNLRFSAGNKVSTELQQLSTMPEHPSHNALISLPACFALPNPGTLVLLFAGISLDSNYTAKQGKKQQFPFPKRPGV